MTDFSGTSILSNEFVVIGRASTDNLVEFLGPRAQCGPCGKKWLKKPKSERNEMELRSFHHWSRIKRPSYGHQKIGQKWPRG